MDFRMFCATVVYELDNVFKKVDVPSVEKLADKIIAANRVFTIGGGREGLVTKAFSMRLTHLGKQTFWIWDDTTPSLGAGDVLLVSTGSCTGGVLTHVAAAAKEKGATVLLVTADNSGPVGAFADHTVFIPAQAYLAKGNLVPTQQPMGNLFEQSLFIFYDALSVMLREKLGQTEEQMESRHRNVE